MNAKPERQCGEPLRLYGMSLMCDRPRGHLPENDHASTVTWSAPLVRAAARRSTTRERCLFGSCVLPRGHINEHWEGLG